MNTSDMFVGVGSSDSLQSSLSRLMDSSAGNSNLVTSSTALSDFNTNLHDAFRQSFESVGLGFNVDRLDSSSASSVLRSPARSDSLSDGQEALFSPQANRMPIGDDFAQLLHQISQRGRPTEALNFDSSTLLKTVLGNEQQGKESFDAHNLAALLKNTTTSSPAPQPASQAPALEEHIRQLLQDGDRLNNDSSQNAANVLAATQSMQLNQKLHMQAAATQKLQTENLVLLRELHNANQQILALQEQVQLLKLSLEKSQANAQFAHEKQLQRESLLQQHNAQLGAKSMDYEQHLKKLQDELAEAKRQCMRLERANGMLSLGIPQTVHPQHKWPRSVGENRTPSSIASRKCYNCGEKGHKATDCPNPRTRQDGGTDASSSVAASTCCSPTFGSPSPGSPMSATTSPIKDPGHFDKDGMSSPCSSGNGGRSSPLGTSPAPPLIAAADGS